MTERPVCTVQHSMKGGSIKYADLFIFRHYDYDQVQDPVLQLSSSDSKSFACSYSDKRGSKFESLLIDVSVILLPLKTATRTINTLVIDTSQKLEMFDTAQPCCGQMCITRNCIKWVNEPFAN